MDWLHIFLGAVIIIMLIYRWLYKATNSNLSDRNKKIDQLEKRISEYKSEISELQATNQNLSKAQMEIILDDTRTKREINNLKHNNAVLSSKLSTEEAKCAELSSQNIILLSEFNRMQESILPVVSSHPQFSIWQPDLDISRLYHTLNEKIFVEYDISINANVRSNTNDEIYHTTLTSCTCKDFLHNTHGKPCKHMYALAWQLGIIRETAPHQLYNEYLHYTKLRVEVSQAEKDIRKIVNTRSQRSPWLAKQLADYQYERDVKISDYINASNPRIKKTDELKRLAKEKRDIAQERNMLQNQLSYLYTMIPWLEEYITTPPKKDVIEDPSDNPEWDTMKYYLSADEYNKLTTTEKYQLALDRYNKRKKNAWEIGIDFERYIGSTYENKGYKVQYRGAIDGLEDMGRDVIAEGNGITYIIQCKRWSAHKTIHEKHIFQLYGSSILYMLDHPGTDVRPLFVTTTTLSERAFAIAKYLNVRVRENTEIKDYPQIKCNIGKSGEKIYHLPFDQQYDHIVISPEKGEFYCTTVAEAESLGFRRAKKWLGTDSPK